jgi:hypothetical protein
LRRYCAVFHPDIREVSSMPFWLVKLLAVATRNMELKSAGEMMAYFEKIGESSRNLSDDSCILGVPTLTLDRWLEMKKQ